MCDRHIVQKKINSVFQAYRTSVLPNIVENQDAVNEDIKSNFIKVNAYLQSSFLSRSSDQTESSLKTQDRSLRDDRPVGSLENGGCSKGESGTSRLTRST